MELSALMKCLDVSTHFLKQCNKQMENREDYTFWENNIHVDDMLVRARILTLDRYLSCNSR